MRIIQVAASLAESDGGTTTAVLGTDQGYRASPDVSVLTLTTDADGNRGRLSTDERARLRESTPDVAVHPRSRPLRIKNSWSMRKKLMSEVSAADLVHIHGVYLAHTVWAWLAARRYGCPYIVQPHGALEPYQARFGRPHKAVWDRIVGRRILTGASALVAASKDEAANLHSLLPNVRVVVMPLGTSSGRARVPDAVREAATDWLRAPRHQRVLFLGRLARKKRPDLLVDAWNRLATGKLAVVGPDGEWTNEQLSSQVTLRRRGSICFPGPVDADGVRWFMHHAGVFVLPSENENFGITVAEAMAGGAAVITTQQTASAEHIRQARAGLVLDSPDAAALAHAIEELLAEPDVVLGAGARGEAYARAHLTWGSAVQQLLYELNSERRTGSPRGPVGTATRPAPSASSSPYWSGLF